MIADKELAAKFDKANSLKTQLTNDLEDKDWFGGISINFNKKDSLFFIKIRVEDTEGIEIEGTEYIEGIKIVYKSSSPVKALEQR